MNTSIGFRRPWIAFDRPISIGLRSHLDRPSIGLFRSPLLLPSGVRTPLRGRSRPIGLRSRSHSLAGSRRGQPTAERRRIVEREEPWPLGPMRLSGKNKTYVVVSETGIPCPSCGWPTQVRRHPATTEALRRKAFYFKRWFYCLNGGCRTRQIIRNEFKVISRPEG